MREGRRRGGGEGKEGGSPPVCPSDLINSPLRRRDDPASLLLFPPDPHVHTHTHTQHHCHHHHSSPSPDTTTALIHLSFPCLSISKCFFHQHSLLWLLQTFPGSVSEFLVLVLIELENSVLRTERTDRFSSFPDPSYAHLDIWMQILDPC